MALWRFGRGWSEPTLRSYIEELRGRKVNFSAAPEEMTEERGWFVDGTDAVIGREPPGPPVEHGPFTRAKQAIVNYDFSDPAIVVGHFDPKVPLVGRDILLEIRVLGFRFLSGVRVHSVRDESGADTTMFGFRYDTLEGHIERGFEWFLLTKRHDTGEIRFRIEARWRLGEFPNWWSKVGFRVVGNLCRELWRRRAIRRMRSLVHRPATKRVAAPGQLAHRGDLEPQRTKAR